MKEPALALDGLLSSYHTISIIGMAKNAGKTVTLNFLIDAFRRREVSLALTSIGRDGERVDIVTKTEKPPIFVYKDTVIATAEKLLRFCDITKKILQVTNINTPMGRIVLVQALSDGFVQLGGPSITTQIYDLMKDIPVDKIIVDGAIDRKTLANPGVTEATVLCTGASYSKSMQKTIEDTRHTVSMFMLPEFEPASGLGDHKKLESLFLGPEEKVSIRHGAVHVQGAVSDSLLLDFITSNADLEGVTVVAEDASKIFIKPATYEKLRIKKAALAVKIPVHLTALTINPFSPYHSGFNPVEFLEKMREAVPVPVYDLRANNPVKP